MSINREDRDWLIWSIQHNAWWAPDNNGYVRSKLNAGRYSFAEASEIVAMGNSGADSDFPNEAMICDEPPTHKTS